MIEPKHTTGIRCLFCGKDLGYKTGKPIPMSKNKKGQIKLKDTIAWIPCPCRSKKIKESE